MTGMERKKRLFISGLVGVLAILTNCQLAMSGQWNYFTTTGTDIFFLGGKAPILFKVQSARKYYFRKQDQKFCQKYYIIYNRAKRDQGDRTFPILKARRWQDIIDLIDSKKYYKKFPLYELIHFWNKHMPKTTTWKRPFPTLKCILEYKLWYKTGVMS